MFYQPFEQLGQEESLHHADFFVSVVIPYCLAPTWGMVVLFLNLNICCIKLAQLVWIIRLMTLLKVRSKLFTVFISS